MKTVYNHLEFRINKMTFLQLFTISLLFIFSCSTGDPKTEILPSGLSVNVNIVGASVENPNGDGSGLVTVTAFAKNAVRYAFRFENRELVESSTGSVQYTYSKVGTFEYTIEAIAYSETGDSAIKNTDITVYKAEPGEDPVAEEEPEPEPEPEPGYNSIVFSDEFEYEGRPDAAKWHHQTIPIIGENWANGELQHYADRAENSYVSDGTLKIKAIKEEYTSNGTTKSYTSARLNSKFAFKYGKVEVRAKLPGEGGTWPAIWTLGANIDEIGNYFGDQYGSVGWPACGEIDIMEQRGWDKTSSIAYFHWGDTNSGQYYNAGDETTISNASSEFHIYALEWDANKMRITLDGELVYELSNTSDKPYDNPHYLLLNIAMGGNLGGDIPPNFLEDIMEIDYVRIYQ
ncbi:MAG: glycoside hydrolase family 16 protein [Flavobacteriaceae bacterium]